MTRLSEATLHGLPASVAVPGYDRAGIATGVVHLGIGAFHRAHQAVFFDDAIKAGDRRWGVLGVSLRSAGVRDQLAPQDGLYCVNERSGSDERLRVIGAVKAVLVAPEDPGTVVAALAAPDTHLVTLTITEKGYKLSRGALDRDDPDVAHDLADLAAPRTAAGFLVAGLAARRAAGLRPFTAMSCDNLPQNGRLLRTVVLEMAAAHDDGLAAWIECEGAFPQTMVDRIVPATTDADLASIAARLGVEDRATVLTEPFRQWVIEDRFCGPRPAFETLGAQVTVDVAPWEEAKLRLLNGAHSGMAYLGGLYGVEFVHEFVADPNGRRFVKALWEESSSTLTPPAGFQLEDYCADLMTRFSNPALEHRLLQIAADGSQKIPQRLLAPAAVRLARGEPIENLGLAIAAWMLWQTGRDRSGGRFLVEDPLAEQTEQALAACANSKDHVDALLALSSIFPESLASGPAFRMTLARQLEALRPREGDIDAKIGLSLSRS